jgi:rhamnosyltransferase
MPSSPSVTVIVLTAGRSKVLGPVLRAVSECVPRPDVIECVWSGPQGVVAPIPPGVRVVTIPAGAFDHGGTRRAAVERCTTEVVAFLSDDALPAATSWLGELLRSFSDSRVAATFGRHVPRPDAALGDRIFRLARYPEVATSIDRVRIRGGRGAFLPISDANAAYRVSALKEVGGFPEQCAFGEDQAIVCALLKAGWLAEYVPEAAVWHSHSHSLLELLSRGRQMGVRVRSQSSGAVALPVSGLWGGGIAFEMIRIGWREKGIIGVALAVVYSGLRAFGYALGWVTRTHGE